MKWKLDINWLIVVFAGIFEVFWVTGLKYSSTPLEWIGTIIAIVISFYLLIYTTMKLPTSTAYAVFVGLGSAGTVITEMLFFEEPFSWAKIGLIALLIIGVIGLKLVTPEETSSTEKPTSPISKQGGH